MDMVLGPIRSDELTPGTVVDQWRVLERLGQGEAEAVYRVEDVRRPGTPLALKFSLRASKGAFDEWAARLKAPHPNVVQLHAYGRWPRLRDGFFFFVRDYVQGRGLPTWVESVNPSFLQVSALISRLAFAIDDIHRRDNWHRDIRPDNIRMRDQDGEPVLLDLRAGCHESMDALAQVPPSPETLLFRSPEALRFQRMNWGRKEVRYRYRPTDDLYALGATAYWLVTGHAPFSPSLPLDQLASELELRPPPPPWEVNERVPRALGAVILRMLAKSPEARPRSGEALNAELMTAVSAGARSGWAARVFPWAVEEGAQGGSSSRILRLGPPPPASTSMPTLPRVVHFPPPPDRWSLKAGKLLWGRRTSGFQEEWESMGPWSRMM